MRKEPAPTSTIATTRGREMEQNKDILPHFATGLHNGVPLCSTTVRGLAECFVRVLRFYARPSIGWIVLFRPILGEISRLTDLWRPYTEDILFEVNFHFGLLTDYDAFNTTLL